ncbi:MAG: hypothetical protein NVSMB51_08930 [Solirubrobacteraceae bacterium]
MPAHSNTHLAEHPPPPAMMQSLGVAGFQLLFEVGGVGVGRQGAHVFLVVAEDLRDGAEHRASDTHVVYHQARFRDEGELSQWLALAAQLGYLRLSGWRIVLTRAGLRSRIDVLNPANGAIAISVPDKCGGSLFGGRKSGAGALLAQLRALQPPEALDRAAASQEQLYGLYLSLAMSDPDAPAERAIALADRAWELGRTDPKLDPRAALEAARRGELADPA